MVFKVITRLIGGNLLIFQRAETKFIWILAALMLLIILNPLLPKSGLGNILLTILFNFIILSGIVAASDEHHILRQIIVIGLVTVALDWLRTFASFAPVTLSILVLGLYTLFLSWITLILIVLITQSQQVTGNLICGAIAGYLLVGITASFIAALIETIQPGSFLSAGQPLNASGLLDPLLYYSLVTLFTIGYGDIIPVTPAAQSLSICLGLLGQIYLTVLVALLVGKYLKN